MSAPRPHRRVSAEQRDRVARLTREGHSAAQVAVILGISDRTVVRIRTELGIAQTRAPFLSESELRCAAALLEDGCPYSEVARSLGRSQTAIRCHFPGLGWTRSEIGSFAILNRRANERMQAVYA